MIEAKQGYRVKEYQGPVKRYCQVLNLKDDSKLIEEYRRRHSEGAVWPETLAAIREVGILEMEIYILGTTIFMIVETPLDFEWDEAMAKMAPKAAPMMPNTNTAERILSICLPP